MKTYLQPKGTFNMNILKDPKTTFAALLYVIGKGLYALPYSWAPSIGNVLESIAVTLGFVVAADSKK